MAVIHKVTCDACEGDLTTAGNCEGYRLSLAVEPIPHHGGFATGLHVFPPLERTHHFCGLSCLDKWLDAEKVRREEASRRFMRGEDLLRVSKSTPMDVNNPAWWDNGGGGW